MKRSPAPNDLLAAVTGSRDKEGVEGGGAVEAEDCPPETWTKGTLTTTYKWSTNPTPTRLIEGKLAIQFFYRMYLGRKKPTWLASWLINWNLHHLTRNISSTAEDYFRLQKDRRQNRKNSWTSVQTLNLGGFRGFKYKLKHVSPYKNLGYLEPFALGFMSLAPFVFVWEQFEKKFSKITT